MDALPTLSAKGSSLFRSIPTSATVDSSGTKTMYMSRSGIMRKSAPTRRCVSLIACNITNQNIPDFRLTYAMGLYKNRGNDKQILNRKAKLKQTNNQTQSG